MKKEYPPLLSVGFHDMSLSKLRDLCVASFPNSKTREPIMDGLEKLSSKIVDKKIIGDLWINGSFLTEKKNPRDSDVVLCIDDTFFQSFTINQKLFLDWFVATDLMPDYLCDSHLHFDYPVGHQLYDVGDFYRAYWKTQFGFSRGNAFKGIPILRYV